jgi:YesN/AraC family two-component response regulator
MSIIHFVSPPMPHYIASGEDTYPAGGLHPARNCIGIFDLIIVTQGSLFMREEKLDWKVTSGQFVILRPDRMHHPIEPCNEQTHFYWLHFQTLGQWSEVSEQSSSSHPLQQDPMVQIDRFSFYIPRYGILTAPHDTYEQFKQLDLLAKQPLQKARWRQQVIFQEIMLQLQVGNQTEQGIQHINIAEETAAYLRANYSRAVSYTELADVVHFHPNYIARCMKRVFGCTPHEYLTRYRIDKAKLLLIHTDEPIGRVAESTGFGSFPFFVRCFTKHTGYRPREFRLRFR